jgi:hypothetical protein
MDPDGIEMIESYRAEVVKAFAEFFSAEAGRFPQGHRLLQRFTETADHALAGSSPLSAMSEAHNEMCVARAMLLNTKPRISSLAYEPAIPGCAKTIDFCGISPEGLRAHVDVKTISPVPTDRWGQFEQAQREKWFPENVRVGLFEHWMGGETWHGWVTGRGRMLEYTLELEQKIREGGLIGRSDSAVILVLCGTGSRWHESQLEDFADFYRSGRHRSDDGFAKMEAHFMEERKIVLERTVTSIAYMERKTTDILPRIMRWKVRGPTDPERLF